jgi:hypothetical protein
MVVCPSPQHRPDKGYRYQAFHNTPGGLAPRAWYRKPAVFLSDRGLYQQSQFGPTSAQALPWFRLNLLGARTGGALGGTGLCLEDYRLR